MTTPLRFRIGSLLIATVAFGCSENFGPPPPDGGRTVDVRAQGATGPVVARTARALALAPGRVWVATDGGLFTVDGAGLSSAWSPAHAGLATIERLERVARVDAVAVDASGERVLHLGRVNPIVSLVGSRDGGRSHERLEVPDPVLSDVGAIAVLGPSSAWPDGAWVAQQGVQVFARALGAPDWIALGLPAAPDAVRALRSTSRGQVLAIVRDGVEEAVWAAEPATPTRLEEVARRAGPVFDAIDVDGVWYVAHAQGIDRDGVPHVRWSATTVTSAALALDGGRLRWTLAGRDGAGTARWVIGADGSAAEGGTVLPADPVAGSLRLAHGGAALLVLDAGVTRVRRADWDGDPARAAERTVRVPELDLRAVVVEDAVAGTLVLGREFAGEVHRGPVDRPEDFTPLGVPPLTSQITALVVDAGGSVVAGSYGTHRFDAVQQRWSTAVLGQSSYQPADFGGPVVVATLARDGEGRLWLGAENGDGVYRGEEIGGIGLVWTALHEGLGRPGSYAAEFGLPLVTQARAFAFGGAGQAYMGGFRGGVWTWDEVASRWDAMNEGLPDTRGAAVDTCCATPGEREIDARDLVVLDDGTLLAATAWGVFARPPGASRWTDSSLGLRRRDVTTLAVHPQRPRTIAAGTTAREGDEPFVYLSEDGGATWFGVDVSVVASECIDLVWSRPSRLELVALLRARGAWRMELAP